MESAARIEALIEPAVEAMGFHLVRVRFGGGRRPVLQIMAERHDGTMSIDDCADLSRALSALLDVEDPVPGEYELEVSSPGIDRPLTRPGDYVRFAGFEARVETHAPIEGRKRFRGRVAGLDGESVLIDLPEGRMRLPFGAIAEGRLVLTDELIQASLKGHMPPPRPVTAEPAAQAGADNNETTR